MTDSFQAAAEAVSAFLKALDEKGDPCANAFLVLINELGSKPPSSSSDSTQMLSVLVKAFKDVAPRMKKIRTENAEADSLPCVKTASQLWNKYSSKIEAILSLVGSLGLAPDGLVDGIKMATKSFSKATSKDEF